MATQQEIEKVKEEVKESMNQTILEEAILDNKFEFEYKEQTYRVRKPTFKEKQRAYRKKVEKMTELLKDKNLMLERDLVTLYKERNIDLNALSDQVQTLEKQKQNIQEKLGSLLANKGIESEIKSYKEEIQKIEAEQINLSTQRTSFLECSIEHQLFTYLYAYLTSVIAEKKVGESWVKVWNSYEEFEDSKDEDFITKIAFYSTFVLRNEINF